MFRATSFLLVALSATFIHAQPGVTYPKVYGPTGSLYGPTQAHYQFQRQYGRPWVSPTGRVVTNPVRSIAAANGAYVRPYNVVPGGYRVGYGGVPYAYPYGVVTQYAPGYGYSGVNLGGPYVNVNVGRGVSVGVGVPGVVQYGPGPFYHQGWESVAPIVRQAHPLWVGQNPFNNSVLARGHLEEQLRWQAPIVVPKTQPRPRLAVTESTAEMKARSLKHRVNGDTWFRKQQYATAHNRYKTALQEAKDVAENHFRVGFALVALGHEDKAIEYFRDGVALDPLQPQTGTPLEELFGPDNGLARSSVILRTADWVREDIRDPDRLFVMGVMLHFDGQEDKATEFFETAYRLAGKGDHLVAFLRIPEEPVAAPAPPAGPPPAAAPEQPAVQNPGLGGVENQLDGPALPFPKR